MTLEDLPEEKDDIDVLCQFAATFPKQDDCETALSALRDDLRSLWRRAYWSLDKSPEYYRSQMTKRVEEIRKVLQQRTNSNPACECARDFFLANTNPGLLLCWTSLDAVEHDAFLVNVFFVIKNLLPITMRCKLLRVSKDFSTVTGLSNKVKKTSPREKPQTGSNKDVC